MSRFSRTLAASSALALALAAMTSGPILAQSEECATTTPEENIAIVEAFVAAHDAADMEQMDAMLHDEFTDAGTRHLLETDETNNMDEHQVAVMLETLYPGSTHRIDQIAGWDDQVVAAITLEVTQHTLTPDGAPVTLEAPIEMSQMSWFTIECGIIKSAHSVSDLYELLTSAGFTLAPAAAG